MSSEIHKNTRLEITRSKIAEYFSKLYNGKYFLKTQLAITAIKLFLHPIYYITQGAYLRNLKVKQWKNTDNRCKKMNDLQTVIQIY